MTDVAANLAAIGAVSIKCAATKPTADDAALFIQTICGIEDGGIASQCLDEDAWPALTFAERCQMVQNWVSVELAYARNA